MAEPGPTRCGFVALIGAPNSGKSTLTNALVGAKVSIVTHKAQTTRGPVRGIALIGNSQVILVDTPGIFRPRRKLDRAMVKASWTGADDADLTLLLVDAKAPPDAALPGGNGLSFDWRLLAGRRLLKPWMLAGGLTPANVAEAVRLTGASVVDVSSGVEAAPGQKGPALIRDFVMADQG